MKFFSNLHAAPDSFEVLIRETIFFRSRRRFAPHSVLCKRADNAELEKMVGLGRFELPTSPLSGVRSNQLSYRPKVSHWLLLAIR